MIVPHLRRSQEAIKEMSIRVVSMSVSVAPEEFSTFEMRMLPVMLFLSRAQCLAPGTCYFTVLSDSDLGGYIAKCRAASSPQVRLYSPQAERAIFFFFPSWSEPILIVPGRTYNPDSQDVDRGDQI